MDDAGKAGMKVVPLARYLAELPRESGNGARVSPADIGADREREIALAVARGEQQGREAARREYEMLLKSERDGFEERLANDRRRWVAEQAEKLSADIAGEFANIGSAISSAAAR